MIPIFMHPLSRRTRHAGESRHPGPSCNELHNLAIEVSPDLLIFVNKGDEFAGNPSFRRTPESRRGGVDPGFRRDDVAQVASLHCAKVSNLDKSGGQGGFEGARGNSLDPLSKGKVTILRVEHCRIGVRSMSTSSRRACMQIATGSRARTPRQGGPVLRET